MLASIRKIMGAAATVILLSGLQGCSSPIPMDRSVLLSGNNYKIVKSRVKGKDYGFKFLGIIGPSASLNEAKDDLQRSSNVNFEGRSFAWANETAEDFTAYLILFSILKVSVTADLVEFVAAEPGKGKELGMPAKDAPIL